MHSPRVALSRDYQTVGEVLDPTPPRKPYISNLEACWLHPRRMAGKYDLSPETQALLAQKPANSLTDDATPGRMHGTDIRAAVIGILERRRHATYGVIDQAVKNAGGHKVGRTLQRMIEEGNVIAEGPRGFRIYSLPKSKRR